MSDGMTDAKKKYTSTTTPALYELRAASEAGRFRNPAGHLRPEDVPADKQGAFANASSGPKSPAQKMSILPEPAPIPNSRQPLWPLVQADWKKAGYNNAEILELMAERDKFGREKYGTPLQAFNGRDMLSDALQELLDALVYLRGEMEQHPNTSHAFDVRAAYERTMSALQWLAWAQKSRSKHA